MVFKLLKSATRLVACHCLAECPLVDRPVVFLVQRGSNERFKYKPAAEVDAVYFIFAPRPRCVNGRGPVIRPCVVVEGISLVVDPCGGISYCYISKKPSPKRGLETAEVVSPQYEFSIARREGDGTRCKCCDTKPHQRLARPPPPWRTASSTHSLVIQ
jgi:hypothetical protein